MASTKLSIASVGVTGHLTAIARKTTDLSTIAASVDTYPANDGNFEFLSLEPGIYRFEVRDSPDGTSLGSLLGPTFSIEVTNDQLEIELRNYTADGVNSYDPASLQPNIIDPYLDGQNVQGVFKAGDRFLIKNLEYTLIAGGGVHLTNGVLFSPGEVFQVLIANVVPVVNTTLGLFAGFATVHEDTLITSALHNNKHIKCKGDGTRLVITIDSISTFGEGKFLYFTTNSGNQKQTVFTTTSGEQFDGFGDTIILGSKEFLMFEKRGLAWEVLKVSDGVLQVGEKVTLGYKSHINTLPEDDTVIESLDYPRIFNWVKNTLPSTHKIVTTDGAIATYTRTKSKMGQFIISETKLRMPNSQELAERGLFSFNNFGTDATRLHDYPGGVQPEQVGPHRHEDSTYPEADPRFRQGEAHPSYSWNNVHETVEVGSTDINKVSPGVYATKNIMENNGVIYSRRI